MSRTDLHDAVLVEDDDVRPPRRRAGDRSRQRWTETRGLLLDALAAPLRSRAPLVLGLAGGSGALELVGFSARRSCADSGCSPSAFAWAQRLDMDALGSVPRTAVTLVLALTALVCLVGSVVAGRAGARIWWLVLGSAGAALAVAKHSSLHSLVEGRLAGLLPTSDVQLLFVVVSVVGLTVVTVSGRYVRQDSRANVITWLALYAVASVGLAAVTVVLSPLGPWFADLSTLVEETGEAVAAVGLLAVVVVEARVLAARRAVVLGA